MKYFFSLFFFLLGSFSASAAVKGRYVRIVIPREAATLSLAEVQIFSKNRNVALAGRASQCSTDYGGVAKRAIDGNTDTDWGKNSVTHTAENILNPWWEVDLREIFPIEKIVLWNRARYESRLNGCSVIILGKDRRVVWEKTLPEVGRRESVIRVSANKRNPVLGHRIDIGASGVMATAAGRPLTPEDIRSRYIKKDNWIETVLATQCQFENFNDLKALIPLLIRDFPEEEENIREEFIGSLDPLSFGMWGDFRPIPQRVVSLYHRKQSGRFDELALRYVEHLPTSLREKYRPLAASAKSYRDLEKILKAYRESRLDRRLELLLRYFNPVALERAVRAFAEQYPDRYQDRDDLLKRIAGLREAKSERKAERRLSLAREIDALYDSIYLRHPAVDFKELLFVRRARAGMRGLPQNWEGNSSVPVNNYWNDVVRAPLKQGGETPVTIHRSRCFVGDVDLDYDADKIIFSTGHEGEKNWRVYECGIGGERLREVTPSNQPDIDFYDPCYLPDGRVIFTATSGFHGVPCVRGSDYVGNLHLLEKDGSIRRLVFDQDNSWCPTVMDNGRILFLRWEYTDSSHYFSRVLMTMNPDGSDQQEYFGSGSYWPNTCFYARTIPGSTTRFVAIVSGHHGPARMGYPVLFDINRGRIETHGAVQTLPGYGKPVANRTRDFLVAGRREYWLYPYPLNEDLYLASMSCSGEQGPFYLVLMDRYDNIIPLWYSNADLLFEPLPLKKRPRPVMPVDRVIKGEKETTLYMVSAEEGPGLSGLPKGTVKALRLYQYEYAPRNTGGHYHIGMEGPWDPRTILGTVKVEEDGSCLFKAPANTPISVQPLDKDGKALQLMRSWLVGMPGETIACMGCHEKQNAAAPVRHSIAGRKVPSRIEPWYGPRRNFAFVREVQGVLDRACVGCHHTRTTLRNGLGERIPGFELAKGAKGFSASYLNLMPYVRRNGPEGDYHILTPLEFHADTSELFQLLEKGHHGVKLSKEEMDRLITWADLNVPYWGTWSEREGESVKPVLARRREMARLWANDSYDHEKIVNPYKPVAFCPPEKPADPLPPPKVEGWPMSREESAKIAARPQVFKVGTHELRFVRIPAGSFVMGSNAETPMERPMGRVTLDKSFLMATCEVTQGLFREFDPTFNNGVYDMHNKDQVHRGYYMGPGSEFSPKNCLDFPAIRVSWERATAFCRWLGARIGRKVMLPTEAQWEWACRAGSDTPMSYGGFETDFGKYENLADASLVKLAVRVGRTPAAVYDYEPRDRRFNDGVLHLAPVGHYKPNAWGLHDMHGNVAEWTRSAYRPYPYSEDDGRNNNEVGERKVVRGGSWYRRPIRATSTWRWGYPGWQRPFDVGFRVVIEE